MERSVEKKITEFMIDVIGGSYKNVVEVALSDILDLIKIEFNAFVDDTLILMSIKKDFIKTNVTFVYNYSEELLYTCFDTVESVKKDYEFEGVETPRYSRIKARVPLYALEFVLVEQLKMYMG